MSDSYNSSYTTDLAVKQVVLRMGTTYMAEGTAKWEVKQVVLLVDTIYLRLGRMSLCSYAYERNPF